MSRRRGVVVLLLAVIAESGLCYDENDGSAGSRNALDAKFNESYYAGLPLLPKKLPFPGQFSNGIGDYSGSNNQCLQWYWVPVASWGSCTEQQLPPEGLGTTETELTTQKPSSKPSPEPADEPSEEPPEEDVNPEPEEELVKESEESPGEQEAPEKEDEEEPSEEPPVLPEEKPEEDLEEYPEEDFEKDPDEDPKEEPKDEDENKGEDENKKEDENKNEDEEKPNDKLPNEQPEEKIEKTTSGGDVESTTKFICMDIDELVPNSFMRCKVRGRLDSGWYYRVKSDSPPVTNIEPSLTFDDLME